VRRLAHGRAARRAGGQVAEEEATKALYLCLLAVTLAAVAGCRGPVSAPVTAPPVTAALPTALPTPSRTPAPTIGPSPRPPVTVGCGSDVPEAACARLRELIAPAAGRLA